MTVARKETVVKGEEGVYHCRNRCVRRAFLCGWDRLTKKNFDYRKEWVLDRLKFLATIFTIDPIAFAVLSNHLHILIRTLCTLLSDEEVAKRWLRLYPKRKNSDGSAMEPSAAEISAITSDKNDLIKFRNRLSDLSWFMKCLDEYIARKANEEDDCTGHFWEGRFKSQRIGSDAAAVVCATYIDLNPIRAEEADSPEESVFTSAWIRINARDAREKLEAHKKGLVTLSADAVEELKVQSTSDSWLAPIESSSERLGLSSVTLNQYLEILDWTGREIRSEKRGKIPDDLKPILERLKIRHDSWVKSMECYGNWFYSFVSDADAMLETARARGKKWLKGVKGARQIFELASAVPA